MEAVDAQLCLRGPLHLDCYEGIRNGAAVELDSDALLNREVLKNSPSASPRGRSSVLTSWSESPTASPTVMRPFSVYATNSSMHRVRGR